MLAANGVPSHLLLFKLKKKLGLHGLYNNIWVLQGLVVISNM